MAMFSVETGHTSLDDGVLHEIDKLSLSPRLKAEREEFFRREPEVVADRAVLAVESWKESETDVLDVRWAKLTEKWCERLPIVIFKGQLVAGSETKLFRGVDPNVEGEAPNVLEIMEKNTHTMRQSAVRMLDCSEDEWDAVQRAVDFFIGKTPVDAILAQLQALYGDWPEEFERARGDIRQGKFNYSSPIIISERLLGEGLGKLIRDAAAGIERVRSGEEPEAQKAWFWQAVIIGCQAVIHLAHRYARLAREMAAVETDPVRRQELEEMAASCEWVPEKPARTLRDAVQARALFGLVMKRCRPSNSVDQSGRSDQYFYPYFIGDLRDKRVTLEQASELIGTYLSNVARRDGLKTIQRGQQAQGTQLSNLTLGGMASDGKDANNELTYLMLHMIGLLRYAEPHYTYRLSKETPNLMLLKALETNRKVGGGLPQFMSDERVIAGLVAQGESLEDARDWNGWG